jgi:hypothetical protein
MYSLTIVPTQKSVKWLKAHKIDTKAMSYALSLLMSEIYPAVKIIPVKLTLQIRFNREDSGYYFRTNKISICEMPYYEGDSQKRQQKEIFNHFLHEFRHWMQSRIFKAGIREIKYTDEDVEYNTNAYYRNKLEVDARQFVRQYQTKFMKYYKVFTKTYPR